MDWLIPKIDDAVAWNNHVMEVCSTYRESMELYDTHVINTFSIDEQTGIQALE